jgi:hypothetical protein
MMAKPLHSSTAKSRKLALLAPRHGWNAQRESVHFDFVQGIGGGSAQERVVDCIRKRSVKEIV